MADLDECQECRSLGRCCWFAVDVGKHASGRPMKVYTRVACPFLDKTTGLCTRYETRAKVPWCKAWWWPGQSAKKTNQPSWCPRNEPMGAMMIESARFFLLAKGEPKDLEEFRRRLDERAVEEMTIQHDLFLTAEGVTLEAGGPLEPPESPATPIPEWKRKQERRKLHRKLLKRRNLDGRSRPT